MTQRRGRPCRQDAIACLLFAAVSALEHAATAVHDQGCGGAAGNAMRMLAALGTWLPG